MTSFLELRRFFTLEEKILFLFVTNALIPFLMTHLRSPPYYEAKFQKFSFPEVEKI